MSDKEWSNPKADKPTKDLPPDRVKWPIKCGVCGMEFGAKPIWYSCPRSNCPIM